MDEIFNIRDRWVHVTQLYAQGVWGKWIGIAWTVAGAVSLWKSEWLSAADQEKSQAVRIIPTISLPTWCAVFAAVLFCWALEASYRHERKRKTEFDRLAHDLAIIRTQQQPKLRIHFSADDQKCMRRPEKGGPLDVLVLPEVLSHRNLTGCFGYLTGIKKFDKNASRWIDTEPPFGTRQKLRWQDQKAPDGIPNGFAPATLHGNKATSQYLNVCQVLSRTYSESLPVGYVGIHDVHPGILRAMNVEPVFRLGVSVIAEGETDQGAQAHITLEVEKRADSWLPIITSIPD